MVFIADKTNIGMYLSQGRRLSITYLKLYIDKNIFTKERMNTNSVVKFPFKAGVLKLLKMNQISKIMRIIDAINITKSDHAQAMTVASKNFSFAEILSLLFISFLSFLKIH